MSEPLWQAVFSGMDGLTVWPMTAEGPGPVRTVPLSELGTLTGPVIAAGVDIAPRPVPCTPLGTTRHVPNAPRVAAIPMLMQETPAARTLGSEAAIAGYLADVPTFDGVILVLGTETCWAQISAREVVSFATFITPELRRALHAAPPEPGPEFDTALSETLSRPDRLAQHLSSARAAGTGQEAAHLIGAEIAAAKPYWLGQNIVILSEPEDGDAYARALTAQGVSPQTASWTDAFLNGCALAWHSLAQGASRG